VQAPTLSGGLITQAITQQQQQFQQALAKSAAASEAAADSLDLQRKAEEAVEALEQQALETKKTLVQWKRQEAKESKLLADAVELEAASVAKSGTANQQAAADLEKLAAASIQASHHFKEASFRALQMARGIALIAAGSSNALAEYLPYILVVEGSIQVLRGAVGISKALATGHLLQAGAAVVAAAATGGLAAAVLVLQAAMGPVALALAALAVIAGGLVFIYNQLTESEQEAADKAAAHQKIVEEAAGALASANERVQIALDSELERIANLDTLVEKESAYRNMLLSRAEAEALAAQAAKDAAGASAPELAEQSLAAAIGLLDQQKSAAEALIGIEQEQAAAAKEKIKDQIELVKLRDRELSQARDALKAEEDKARAIRASLGALNQGEQSRLRRLLEAANSGELSRNQALQLSKLGGQAGQDIAEVFLAKMDRGLGELAEKTRAKVTGEDPRAQAQANFQQSQAALNEATGGQSAEAKIASLRQQLDEQNDLLQEHGDATRDLIRGLIDDIRQLQQERSRQQQGARAARGAKGV
jgi:hypothetical protein